MGGESSQVKSSQAKSSQVKSSQVESSQVKLSQVVKANQVKPTRRPTKTNQINSKPNHSRSGQQRCQVNQVNPCQAKKKKTGGEGVH